MTINVDKNGKVSYYKDCKEVIINDLFSDKRYMGMDVHVEFEVWPERWCLLTDGKDGKLREAMYGDWVVARYIRGEAATIVCPFNYSGEWKKIDGDVEQFYYDRLHPSNRYRLNRVVDKIEVYGKTIPDFIAELSKYSDETYRIDVVDDTFEIWEYRTWEEGEDCKPGVSIS